MRQPDITEADGTNHFRVERGTVMFWFAPNWCGTNQGGTGPAEWSRLIEVGAYTTNASYGWWSLYTDPAGANLYFSAQTNNGYGATYLTAPIHWDITNRWHLIALTYSGTNSALWVDAVLITNGLAVTCWPGADVLADGFFIGSDSSGLSQAHGMFDDLVTYDYEIDGATISNVFGYQGFWYYMNPMNAANLVASAPSSPTLTPSFNAVTGQGYLIPVTNAFNNCLTNSQVWLTNVVASMASNLMMDVTFTIAGGSNAVLYDVFANSLLDFSTNRERAWAWMGQGSHCMTYLLTNLPESGVFIILGTPLDSDADGLTDAYEQLVSQTDPQIADTDGDGTDDGVEVLVGTNPLNYDQPSPLKLPQLSSSSLRILAPDLLELNRVSFGGFNVRSPTNRIGTFSDIPYYTLSLVFARYTNGPLAVAIFDGGVSISLSETNLRAYPGQSANVTALTNYLHTNNLWGNIPTPSQKSNLVNQVSIIIGQPIPVKEFAWDFVDDNGSFTSPLASKFSVSAGGAGPVVSQTGFRRRPLYAPFETFDYRLEKTIFLKLSSQIPANTTVEVKNPDGSYWPSTLRFVATNDPSRYSPAIHVNQQGYSPTYQKKAMIGYNLGSLGEMQVSTNSGFSIVDALTGTQVASGSLSARPDDSTTWATGQAQYQSVVEADFTGLTTTGQYKLLVPGLGASYPFWIHDGSAMALARTYALGLYHQRCGAGPSGLQVNNLPFTRFVHGNCHTNNATVPLPVASYADTWNTMANTYGTATYTANSDNPPQIAPSVTNYSAFLFPYSNNFPAGVDVSGGHHDAGDYSKYTVNSALLIHILTFAADNLGLTNFLNFGIPKGTNAAPDALEEARIEADFLIKLQDSDGGFYFLVYPRNREYELDVLPQNGDPQIVWPKTTAATAAAVAALAEIASSPAFSRVPSFRSLTNGYMQAALKGWTFLTNAIATRGKVECYQRITTYGDDFTHDDELAWAAAALYAATGSSVYSNKLYQWYPKPADGHNGYNFKRYDTTNSFPSNTNLFVAVAYLPKTNDVFNTTNRMWFTIWDSTGRRVVTNKIETGIPHFADIQAISNRLFHLKVSFNTYPDSLDRNSALDDISSLVGECHKTWRDGWLRCFAGYGCAVRDYAFAARSGRLGTNLLNSSYLQQCETELTNRAADVRTWSTNNAYGTSLDSASKSIYSKGWFFGGEQAFDVAVANQIQSHPGNIPTIIENLNYEAGRNPLNVSRLTGIGSYQQREVVHQFAQNNPQAALPPTGVPLGNISSYFDIPIQSTAWHYGYLDPVCFPRVADQAVDKTTFPLYERWAETYNIHTEFVALQTARGLVSAAYLVSSAAIRTQAWSFATATIDFPSGLPALATKCVARLASTQDLSQARITWDPGRASWNFLGQNPVIGSNFIFIPASVGDGRTLQAEALLPDGRRLFAVTNLFIFDPIKGGTNFVINDTNTIALYHFDATNSGKFLDATTNHLDLTIFGKAALATNTSWMRSPSGAVVRFSGVGDYIEITNLTYTAMPQSLATPLTIEARIYPRKYLSLGSAAYLLRLHQDFDTEWSLYYAPAANYPQIFAPQASPLLSVADWGNYIAANTWHWLKVTVNTNGLSQLHIDGTPRGSSSVAPNYGRTTPWTLHIGDFEGDIDEVRISNTLR